MSFSFYLEPLSLLLNAFHSLEIPNCWPMMRLHNPTFSSDSMSLGPHRSADYTVPSLRFTQPWC